MLTVLQLSHTRPGRRWRSWIIAFMVIGLGVGITARPAVAQENERPTCEEAIAQAESAYLNGNFQEAINQVSACLDRQDASEDQIVASNRLLSLSHLRLNELQQARAAIVNIFGVRPGYEADPVEDPPEYVSLVSIVRQEVQPEVPPAEGESADDGRTPFFRRTSTWLALVGSVAVGGVVTFLTLGQGGGGGDEPPPTGPNPLPPPPGTPSGN